MRVRPIAVLGIVPLVIAACSSAGSADEAPEDTTLTVFAAASLATTFTELGGAFEKAHEDLSVEFNFAGSSDLAAQIQQGAPADVFASADASTMATVTADNLVEGEPARFATNTLQIATPAGNPAAITGVADLARSDVTVVLCAPQVPCGSASARVLAKAGIAVRPVSEEQSVTDVLGKVISGEADAGLVYVTDVISAGDQVTAVDFPESSSVVTTYLMAALVDARNAAAASEFVDFVTSPAGQRVLSTAGFGAP